MNPPEVRHDDRLAQEQVDQLYAQSYIATLGSATAAVLTGFFLWPAVASGDMAGWWMAWVAAAVCGTVFRHFFIIRYRSSAQEIENIQKKKAIFIGLVFLSGTIWGSSVFVIFPTNSFIHQILLSFILAGMVAGSMPPFSVVYPAFLAYAIPTLLPAALYFFLIQTSISIIMGVSLLFYLCFMGLCGYQFFRRAQSILLLKFENLDLIRHLEAEKIRTDAVNTHLKDEIAERKRIEEILKRHRENLEGMVDERTSALQRSNMDLKNEIRRRTNAQQALKESEEKYRLVVENASDAIFVLQEGVSKFHNQRTESLLGYSTRELQEIPFSALCRISEPDFPGNRIEQDPESRSPGMAATLPLQLRTKDQKSLWVQISAVPVQWVNAPALLCFIRDVTQQKLLENQLLQTQKIDAIGAMAGGIAHDFNNILSAIQGNTSLALMGMAPTHQYYKKFKDIETYAASGTELTRQLLDFAGSTTKHPEPLDLHALLRETAAMFSRTRKEIRLRDRYVKGRPIIEADAGQIRQAVLNLLINAWQSMPNGGEIEIETALTRPGDVTAVVLEPSSEHYIRVTISDTGAGMTPELMSKIFDPFFTTKKKEKGTGLGLPSVYGIVQRHGGHIHVESRPGKGSRFHLYLPLSQKPAVAASPDEDAIQTGTETILIIDDEPDILEIGREMLEVLGYAVHAAGSGGEALRLYAQHKERIDLVILDMIMPEMNGEMVYRRLSEINPLVRVLIASGYSPVGPARNLLTQKSCGFIQKPFKIQQLSQAIRKLLAPEAA